MKSLIQSFLLTMWELHPLSKSQSLGITLRTVRELSVSNSVVNNVISTLVLV